MTSLAMNDTEIKTIDSQVEQMMDWAKSRQAEAEQLALDAARLMACTGDRMDRLSKQGFFKRCWNRLTGKTGAMERANTSDLIQMQKVGFRYINMLQEQQMLMAHSLLSLKNNLISLAVKEEETRNLVALLAQKTLERFEKLEHRVDQLEISTNLQGWLLSLEERDYDEKFPTDYMRIFRVINDFYGLKKDNWNFTDLMFMRKALRTVGINPKQKISLNTFINKLTDEIQSASVGFESYEQAICLYAPDGMENYSKFVVDNISSPVFVSLHGLKMQYVDRLDIVEALEDEMNISTSEALKILLRRSIANMNVNLDYEFPMAETAIEILGCLRLAEKLALPASEAPALDQKKEEVAIEVVQEEQPEEKKESDYKEFDIDKMQFSKWKTRLINLPKGSPDHLGYKDGIFYLSADDQLYSCTDLEEWELSCDFKTLVGDYSYWPDMKFLSCGSLLFYLGRESVLCKQPDEDWRELNVPSQYKNDNFYYKKVFHIGDKWFVWGSNTRLDHLFSGNSITDLQRISSLNDFEGIVRDMTVLDGKLVAFLYNYGDKYVIVSEDGVSWKKYPCQSNMNDSMHLYTSHKECYFHDYNNRNLFKFNVNNGELTPIKPNIKIEYGLSGASTEYKYIIEDPHSNLVFYVSESNLYVSTDFIVWNPVDIPSSFSGQIRDMIFTGEKLVLLSGGSSIRFLPEAEATKIVYCDVKSL